jgi:ketosteroid isomerase-like protein
VSTDQPPQISAEKLRLLGEAYEAFNRDGWEGMVPFLDGDFEFHEPPEQPGATVFYGIEAARKGWARWAEAWTEQRSEFESLLELPDGRLLILTRERMKGREGLEVEHEAAQVVTLRGDKILRWATFWDRGNAAEALGMREEDLNPAGPG